uniref:Ig-like domain-containing protein n=1 Tax=Zea mays TaxID=4577 RepID=A0A804R3V9_MAIZE
MALRSQRRPLPPRRPASPRVGVASAPNRLPERWPSCACAVPPAQDDRVFCRGAEEAGRGGGGDGDDPCRGRKGGGRPVHRGDAGGGHAAALQGPGQGRQEGGAPGAARRQVADHRRGVPPLPRRQQARLPDARGHRRPRRRSLVCRVQGYWFSGLERSEPLGRDLEWFRQQGHAVPEPSAPGIAYASFLVELSEKNPPAFVCHFYNVYFAHAAGGRIIGKKVAEKLSLQKELEFYEWEGDLSQLQRNVRSRLNRVASGWSRVEKDRCLGEMEKAFTCSVDLRRHMFPC